MEVLQNAARSYYAGRSREGIDDLQQINQKELSPQLKKYWQANILACRMQMLLSGGRGGGGGGREGGREGGNGGSEGGGLKDVQTLLLCYRQLWERMRGVPSSVSSLPAELAVLLSLCQLEALLSRWTNMNIPSYIAIATERIRMALSSSSSCSQPLPHLLPALRSCYGDDSAVVRSVEKMVVIQCVVVCVEGSLGSDAPGEGKRSCFVHALEEHSKWRRDSQAEIVYREGWLQYCRGDYQRALHSLSSASLHPSPLSSLANLLSGVCHAKQDRMSLAQLSWQRCLSVSAGDTLSLFALQNCSLVCVGSQAVAMRELEKKALCLSPCERPLLPVWLWEGEGGSVCVSAPPPRSLAEATYCQFWSDMECGRYREASEVILECIKTMESGQAPSAPSPLPPPSLLLLLRMRGLLCCGDWQGVLDTGHRLLPDHNHHIHTHLGEALGSEVTFACAMAALQLGEWSVSRHWSHRCVEFATEELGGRCGGEGTLSVERSQRAQYHALSLLALLAIANGQWREALQLLAGVVATPASAALPETTPTSAPPIALFNYCLLQWKLGHVGGGAKGWLRWRGQWPGVHGSSEEEMAREWLQEARTERSSLQPGDRKMDYLGLDIACLTHWLQHHRK